MALMYALAGHVPARVERPAGTPELSAILRACDDARESVVLFGGGTLQGIGAAPDRYDVAVDLRAINGILAFEPGDLTISVRAGTPLSVVNAALAEHGQFLPLDAPSPQAGTAGGALASGWSGPRRTTYGRPRDFVIGSTVVLADGTVAKAGGMVVKNVTGYDMSKLYAGSLGTLGAFVTVNFKTLPMPRVLRGAVAAIPEGTLEATVAHVRVLAIEPSAALTITGFPEIDGTDGVEGRLVLFFEGSQGAVDRATRDLRSALGAGGLPATTIVDEGAAALLQRTVDARVSTLDHRSATYRLAGHPSDVLARGRAFAVKARALGLLCETMCDVRAGDVVARVSRDTAEAFETCAVPFDDALREMFAGATLLASPQRVRARLDAWGAPPAAIETMRGVKRRFDPNGTLAPGRFVGGI